MLPTVLCCTVTTQDLPFCTVVTRIDAQPMLVQFIHSF
jgi:hypothetical protein